MNSINRTEMFLSAVNLTKSSISESLSPLTTTTFNFTDRRPGMRRAASSERRTAPWPGRRVIISNLKGSKVSRLIWISIGHYLYKIRVTSNSNVLGHFQHKGLVDDEE